MICWVHFNKHESFWFWLRECSWIVVKSLSSNKKGVEKDQEIVLLYIPLLNVPVLIVCDFFHYSKKLFKIAKEPETMLKTWDGSPKFLRVFLFLKVCVIPSGFGWWLPRQQLLNHFLQILRRKVQKFMLMEPEIGLIDNPPSDSLIIGM